jgi:fructosamine-3-kinase
LVKRRRRAENRDQREVFIKKRPGASVESYRYEAAGLEWLRVAYRVKAGCPIPRVHDVGTDRITMDFVPSTAPSKQAAAVFGVQLARTHRMGADFFGQLPPTSTRAFIADLPLPTGNWETFGSFYAQARIRPLTERLLPVLTQSDYAILSEFADAVESEDPALLGPTEPIARLHGDLWSGNVLWRKRDCVLIDPSAHGGHRESDLAMLELFGLPFLDEVLDAYHREWPLTEHYRQRIPLHQVYPLLVHGILFGGSYPAAAVQAARTALATVCR